LLVATRRLFSWNFEFRDDGRIVGQMQAGLSRERADLDLDDGTYSLYRDQVIGGDYIMDRGGRTFARASKPLWWRSNLDVTLRERSVALRRPFFLSRRFGVFERDRQVGSISPGVFMGGARIELPKAWPLADRIFLFWLCSLMWRRQPDWMIQIS
jgi:hypothetical protein